MFADENYGGDDDDDSVDEVLSPDQEFQVGTSCHRLLSSRRRRVTLLSLIFRSPLSTLIVLPYQR